MFSNRIPWVILLLVWMAGSTWWHVCKIKLLCADSPSPTPSVAPASTVSPTAAVPGLTVTDGDRFRYDAVGNFSFARSGAVANRRGVGALLDSLADYLKANPGKTLTVNGYYSPDEQNSTRFANLGLARADAIRQILRQQGLSDSLLVTNGVIKDDLIFSAQGDSIYGGLAFLFGEPAPSPVAASTMTTPVVLNEPTTEEALAKGEKFTSVFEPIDLYFPLGEAYYIKTPETAKFFSEAAAYLTQNKTKALLLTGHTDNSGSDAVNLQLSRDRANAVKAQLRKLGINTLQIQVEAKGETAPKADNSTLSGRKANRRVTVVVR